MRLAAISVPRVRARTRAASAAARRPRVALRHGALADALAVQAVLAGGTGTPARAAVLRRREGRTRVCGHGRAVRRGRAHAPPRRARRHTGQVVTDVTA